MSSDGYELDGWNYSLYSLEIIMNLLFIPTVFLLFYIFISQKNLHVNLRSTLFLAAFGHLMCTSHRLFLVAARFCCIAQRNAPIVTHLLLVQDAGINIASFGMLFVVIERAIASRFTTTYELQCTGLIVPSLLCSTVVFLAALISSVSYFHLIAYFDVYMMIVQISVFILILVALIVIVLVNISLYRQRHHFMMDLTNKYQMDENIRVCRYLIPVAINNVMTQVVFILLIAYSVFFTDIPLGHDTSYLSHAYDLLLAYERDFFVIALVLRSQKFDQLVKRRRRTSKVVEMEAAAAATSDHFNSLKKMWS